MNAITDDRISVIVGSPAGTQYTEAVRYKAAFCLILQDLASQVHSKLVARIPELQNLPEDAISRSMLIPLQHGLQLYGASGFFKRVSDRRLEQEHIELFLTPLASHIASICSQPKRVHRPAPLDNPSLG